MPLQSYLERGKPQEQVYMYPRVHSTFTDKLRWLIALCIKSANIRGNMASNPRDAPWRPTGSLVSLVCPRMKSRKRVPAAPDSWQLLLFLG